jgi:glycosyltransferase involved in cell wall biosynthesis
MIHRTPPAILYIFQDEYPWDVRVEKIAGSLAKHHKVNILCRNRGKLLHEEVIGNVNVYRVGRQDPQSGSVTGFPAFFSPWWISRALTVIRRQNINLIIVRDLPLSPLALLLRKLTGVPVIFDMAEDYPAMIRDAWNLRGPKLIDLMIRNPKLLTALENFVLKRVDATWVVSPASRERVVQKTNGTVEIVANTPTVDILDYKPPNPTEKARLSVVYTGWVDEVRGVDTVIRAVALGRDQGFMIDFNIVGVGRVFDQLKQLTRQLKVEKQVNFLGWLGQDELRQVIARSDIGIVPHRVTAHTSTTIPNKIFDYMGLGKPVVVSSAPALEDIVSRAGCGLAFQDGNPASLLGCLRSLQAPELRLRMGFLGRKSIVEKFNWSNDERVLLESVERVTGKEPWTGPDQNDC